MEVSTFELLVKRIAPRMALPPVQQPVARRVVQGYFLTVSNLESIDLRYRLEFRISLPDNLTQADAMTRLLEGNTVLIIDIAGANTVLTLTRVGTTGRYVSQEFIIPAQKTASIQLLPDVARFAAQDNPMLEIRGFVSLLLPRVFGGTPIENVLGRPQSPRPVRVLLNAEVRGTFLPNDFPANSASTDFDQINYSLALASGRALNELTSEPPRILVPGSPIGVEIAPGAITMTPVASETADLGAMLAGMLTNGNGASLESLNRSLSELDLPITMKKL
ncbi:hypothetical protein [Leptolyngbya sp. NIES-2104]|uniref:hypothetical protein n=1 Tax=Leptolyngbya sp. NIES-2104 TaxID=1552121 RepID=UPI0006EC59FB|nr:hypothetical protein [Leptolyngbya sp. NIES-2104]GAP98717.1 hypothetical protein NIES2104_52730 [Leptolyngbya sp. NIES-2104]